MGEEVERKRISTNPFLYTDGSLVEAEELGCEDGEEGEGGVVAVMDPDTTPQAEVPPPMRQQAWGMGMGMGRPPSAVSVRHSNVSIDIDDDKVLLIYICMYV